MNILEEFRKLPLEDYPIAKIDSLLSQIGKLCFMITDYPTNMEIERAVNNTKDEPEFNKVSRLSYKPAEYNSVYLRASTPQNTMFYGAVIPTEETNDEDSKYERLVGITEISTLIRNSEIREGWSRVTFGKWKILEPISLATIIDPTKDYEKPYFNQLQKKYADFLEQIPEEIRNNTIEYLKFFSGEFSKQVSNGNNHQYLLSSKFTEYFVNNSDFDGIIYPSVQSEGYGLCVAIHPRSMKKLSLAKVLQCVLVKYIGENGETLFNLINEKHCAVVKDSEIFVLNEIKE